ncbi:hypothetical protein SLS63_012292 [Diaporthe eres]|uniref:Uncharacterized protein n=1 Tax=Diaporthe eres TaxID=83184 RepID=A0ABR1NRK8_DIAER
MYFSLKTILVLGAAVVAAVPITNAATPDAIRSQGLDVSGSPIFAAAKPLIEQLDDDTHLIVERRADGTGALYLGKGEPNHTRDPDSPLWEGLAAESRELTQADDLTARDAEQSKCKWRCLKKYGPLLGRKCMKKCKD